MPRRGGLPTEQSESSGRIRLPGGYEAYGGANAFAETRHGVPMSIQLGDDVTVNRVPQYAGGAHNHEKR